MHATKKLYYLDNNARKCSAKVIKIHESAIELDQTIAYPEGGGQEGDHGIIWLVRKPEIRIAFNDAQLIMTMPLSMPNLPNCKTKGVILHKVMDEQLLQHFSEGDEIYMELDNNRREMLSKSHSATHLVYWALDLLQKEVVDHTIGCHIKPDTGRLDFSISHRFTQSELEEVEGIITDMIDEASPIKVYSRDDYPDVRYWTCKDYIISCGGTHVANTKEIPYIKLRRKNIGKGKERIIFTWRDEEDD